MTFFLCLIFLSSPQREVAQPKINLTELGIFQPAALSVFKLDKGFLLATTLPEEKLQVVDEQGALLFEYAKSGKGPDELHYHSVLAVTKDRIYVHSLGAGVLIFDHQLNLLPESQNTRRLEKNIAMIRPKGVSLNGPDMFVIGHPFLEHHVFRYALADAAGEGVWQLKRAEVEKMFPESGVKDPETALLHQDFLFTYRLKLFEHRPEYHVLVRKFQEDSWQPVTELKGAVEEAKDLFPSLKALVQQVLKTKTGFVVHLASAHPNPASPHDHTSNYDLFDENGMFQRRISKLNHQIIRVTGSPLIFEVTENGEADVLVPFSFAKTDSYPN